MSNEPEQPPGPPPENQAPGGAPQETPGGPPPAAPGGSDKKLIAGLLGILLGCFGVHKFYLGYQKEGLIMLLFTIVIGGGVTLITCGVGAPLFGIMGIIGLIEGILYLTKTDQEFEDTYIKGTKPWF